MGTPSLHSRTVAVRLRRAVGGRPRAGAKSLLQERTQRRPDSPRPWPSRGRLREAAQNSPWLSSRTRETLILASHLGADEDSASRRSPYATEEISELTLNHRGRLADGLALWIEDFDPSARDIGIAISALRAEGIPDAVVRGLSSRRQQFDPTEKAQPLPANVT